MIDDRSDASRGPIRPGALAVAGLAVVGVVEAVSFAADGAIETVVAHAPGADKALHVAGFLVLYLGCLWLLQRWTVVGPRARVLLALAVLVLAAGDELAQGFRGGRSLERADLGASTCGTLLGLGFALRGSNRNWASGLAIASLAAGVGIGAWSYQWQRHMNAALRFERAGDFKAARREYQAAYANGASGSGLMNELAWVEIESGEGDPAAAVRFAERALEHRPDNPDYLDTYGWALHHAGRSAEALLVLQRAYGAKPDIYCIHLHLGEVYLALGQRGLAREHLEKQVTLVRTREAGQAARTLAEMDRRPPS